MCYCWHRVLSGFEKSIGKLINYYVIDNGNSINICFCSEVSPPHNSAVILLVKTWCLSITELLRLRLGYHPPYMILTSFSGPSITTLLLASVTPLLLIVIIYMIVQLWDTEVMQLENISYYQSNSGTYCQLQSHTYYVICDIIRVLKCMYVALGTEL